jgi:ABC-type multidrug transport system fused ATPase/permease subunit
MDGVYLMRRRVSLRFSGNIASLKRGPLGRSISTLSKRERKLIGLVIVIQIFLSGLDLLGVVIFGLVGSLSVSGLSAKQPGDRVSDFLALLNIQNSTLQHQVTILGTLAASVLVIKTVSTLYLTRRTLFFLSRRGARISGTLLSKMMGQNLLKFQSKSMQETIYAVTSGVQSVNVGILGAASYLVADISLLIILGIGLFLVDTVVALSTLLIFSIIAIALYRALHLRVRVLGKVQSDLFIESNERIVEVISSYRELIVKNRRSYYAREIARLRLDMADSSAEFAFLSNVSKYILEITVVVGSLFIAAVQFMTQTASHAIAVLSIFLVASTRIAPAVLRVQQGLLQIKGNIGSATPTLELIEALGSEESIDSTIDTLRFEYPGFSSDVNISKVSIRYPGRETNALSDVTLKIRSGEIIALVGPSGAGKTTLVDCLLGILEPDKGSVLISRERPLDAISKWPGSIAYVPQDVMIMNGTIRENVAMGYPENSYSVESIWEALETAHLSEYVKSLENGIDSPVGDRGTKMSGGQRQRLGIARAMFTKPHLLVLDEATSALDGETEAGISDSIQKMRGEVTVILIAHRLSTVRSADNVVYLEAGNLVAEGTFEEVRKSVKDFDRQARLMGL